MTLTELANKYGTDKGTEFPPAHGYTEIYQRYFDGAVGTQRPTSPRESVARVLEIGIQYGASLRMWRDFFPQAEVIGIDNSEAWVNGMLVAEDNQHIGAVLGDVCGRSFWLDFSQTHKEGFDLVVDDGGHTSKQIVDAWKGAWPLLRAGGLYIIEDLHAVYEYEEWKPAVFGELEQIWHTRVNEFGYGQSGKRDGLGGLNDVEWMHFYKSVVIMKKRS